MATKAREELAEVYGEKMVAKYGEEELIRLDKECKWREGKCGCPLCVEAAADEAANPLASAGLEFAIKWALEQDGVLSPEEPN
jgi:hypothetical protein